MRRAGSASRPTGWGREPRLPRPGARRHAAHGPRCSAIPCGLLSIGVPGFSAAGAAGYRLVVGRDKAAIS
ncbi:hypothetical protein GCM10023224_42750 [Streptomonospora halophila]|uniref:Uncharacterized protein n=1 Tax=Streptomonospora halophila TaxID=427369 RepID=A0ABP9GU99_9ACTN